MRVDERSFPDPKANLDYDEHLLRAADQGGSGEVLRFWESPSVFVVLGRSCSPEADVNLAVAAADGVPVLRRSSGGGTVVQGPGCLNVAVVLRKDRAPALQTISGTYRYVLDRACRALVGLGVAAVFRPVCDLALTGTEQKFSGNAQHRGRDFILHHGTILYAFDLALVSRYLRMPARVPEYRRGRDHRAFVTNITAGPAALRQAFVGVWC